MGYAAPCGDPLDESVRLRHLQLVAEAYGHLAGCNQPNTNTLI